MRGFFSLCELRKLYKPCEYRGRQDRLIRPAALNIQYRYTCNKSSSQSFEDVKKIFIEELSSRLPRFELDECNVKVLKTPTQFYSNLLELIGKAKNHIYIFSLYVGKDERNLVDALSEALRKNNQLRLKVLVDYLRSTREHPNQCSASLLSELKSRFPDRVDVHLFHTPELYGWRKSVLPRRFDEGLGLQHMKFYGIDDDVIMSGANLSHDYFVNRQDRYLLLSNQPELSKYFQDLFHTTCLISYQLSSAPNLPAFKLSWPSSNVHSSPTHSSSSLESFKSIAHELYRSLTVRWQEKSQIKMKAVESDRCISRRGGLVSIFPVLQMGSFRINQETSALIPKLIEFAKELSNLQDGYRTRLNWTSGYFSLLREYKQQLLESDLDVQIITASPEANGFYNSRGVSKYIPSAYTYLEYMFYKDIISKQKQDKIQIREWKRPGWTYHAKGIWITRTIERMGSEQEVEEECLLTTIGSSNYGRRSAERDLECNLILINNRLDPKKPNQPESSLSKELIEELNQLRSLAVDKVDEDLFRSQERRVGLGVKLATRLIRNML